MATLECSVCGTTGPPPRFVCTTCLEFNVRLQRMKAQKALEAIRDLRARVQEHVHRRDVLRAKRVVQERVVSLAEALHRVSATATQLQLEAARSGIKLQVQTSQLRQVAASLGEAE